MKNNKLSNSIARVISTLFVPPTFTVFVFTYCAFIIEINVVNQVFIVVNSLIFGLILPVIVFFRMRKEKRISDIDTSIKEERNAPYLLNSIFCIAPIPSFLILGIDYFFSLLWIIFFINTLILYLINKKWKISAHLLGAAISLGAIMFLEANPNYFLLGLIFMIAWARIKLKIHDFSQVIAGALLGFSITFASLIIFYKYII